MNHLSSLQRHVIGPVNMAEGKKKTVVIAVDTGKHSEHAFDWYMENLHCEGDDVIVFHCEEILYKPADPLPNVARF
ncbi:hypothetical protein QZH41_016419 [Actinostola sp. cb2023]|nr:hypothetical protein QZH41_016419 [Actinostola sp. cb2023]